MRASDQRRLEAVANSVRPCSNSVVDFRYYAAVATYSSAENERHAAIRELLRV